MSQYLVCEGSVDLSTLTCSTGWQVAQAVDFSDLVSLLEFDPEICAYIIGVCVLFFIIGHAAGHVARILMRV
ncbi:hypothetical protein [Cellvibrio sp. UBA7661]|uniref:hypothetical protein n=1 Tax=Cellvibrio sp. UBA7661 TaxID=1946311 RepID=UPI002F3594DD